MALNPLKPSLIVDVLCLQVAWFTAALLHERATLFVLLILVLRLFVIKNTRAEIKPALVLTSIGLASETLMILSGLISYNTAFFMPLWLPLLWLIFGFTMTQGMKFMCKLSLPIRALLGAVSGWSSYQAAASFGVLELHPDRVSASIALLMVWAITLPLLASAHDTRNTGMVC